MYLYLSHDVNSAAFRVHFPSTLEQVQHEIAQMGGASPVQIVGTSSYADRLANPIRFIDLSKEANIEKLNRLAEQVDNMDERSERIFSGALDAESINELDDVLRVASSLGQYEFIEGVTSDKELGGWLVEHGLAGVDFPQQVRPYLDYAGIGAAYYADHGGAYTVEGYVKRRENAQTQAVDDRPMFALTLASSRCEAYRLELPATGGELEQAKAALKLDNLDAAMIDEIDIGYSWAHLLPREGFAVDNANTLAQYVQAMSETELRTLGAALEAEEPATFTDAVCIAEDIDCYELVDVTEGEYAQDGLRMAGAGDEIFDLLDGYTDYERMGRAMMEEDGVRETAFGQIKRLSGPFPSQEEIGPTMC